MPIVPITSVAAPHTAYINSRGAFYDAGSDRTYVAYLGLNRDLYVTYYDHATDTVASPVEVGPYPIGDSNNHGAPSICLGADGRINVVWGAHNSGERHSRSDVAGDISSWTSQNLSVGTYPTLHLHQASGDLIMIHRSGSGHGSFPAHEFGAIQVSADNGATWSAQALLFNVNLVPGGTDWYRFGAFMDNDLLHLAWTIAEGGTHDDTRRDIYHAIYDHTDGHIYTIDGTDLGTSTSDMAACRVFSSGATPIGLCSITVRSTGEVVIPYTRGGNANEGGIVSDFGVVTWNGTAWSSQSLGLGPPRGAGEAPPAAWETPTGWRALFSMRALPYNNLELWEAPASGVGWTSEGVLEFGDMGEGYVRSAPAPAGALIQQEHVGYPTTAAAAPDLLALQLVVDEADLVTTSIPGGMSLPFWTNASITTLSANATVLDDPITVSDGSEFPAGDFVIAVWDQTTTTTLKAVIHVGARTGNSLGTLTWNYDGHTDVNLVSGDLVAIAAIERDYEEKWRDPIVTVGRNFRDPADTEWDGSDLADDFTVVTVSGTQTLIESDGSLSALFAGQSTQDFNCALKAHTFSVGDSFAVPIRMAKTISSQIASAGIIFSDGVTSAANAVTAHFQATQTEVDLRTYTRSGTLTAMATPVGQVDFPYSWPWLWMRLTYQGANTFRRHMSPDGINWATFGAVDATPTITPTHVGVCWSTDSTGGEVIATFGPLRKLA